MLATQMAPSLGQSIGPSSNTIQRDVREILSGGQYYVTPELGRELRSIDKGINHINLDNAFLQSSRSWGNRFDQGQLMAEKQGKFSLRRKVALSEKLGSDLGTGMVAHVPIYELNLLS